MATRKDGDPPKGPKTSYIFFMMSTKSVIAQANPEMKPAEVMKAVREQWKDLDEKAKEKFVKMAEQDKIRHKNECESFIQAGGKLEKKTTKARPSSPASVTFNVPVKCTLGVGPIKDKAPPKKKKTAIRKSKVMPIKVKAPPKKKKTAIRKSEVMPDSPNTTSVKTPKIAKQNSTIGKQGKNSEMGKNKKIGKIGKNGEKRVKITK